MGAQHWWPAGSAFEVVVGAYLTQNTTWTNVERAMNNLGGAGVLSISGIRNIGLEKLEQLVRPAGYFRQKAARLKLFVGHLDAKYGGSLAAMFARPTEALREELLGLAGIGPETADAILLYAAGGEVFVVDSYTRRIFERHGLAKAEAGYEEIRLMVQQALSGEDLACGLHEEEAVRRDFEKKQSQWGEQDQQTHLSAADPETRREGGAPGEFEKNHDGDFEKSHDRLPKAHRPSRASEMKRSELSQRYNEFHALLVQTAKHYCVKGEPRCESCPLLGLLPPGRRPR